MTGESRIPASVDLVRDPDLAAAPAAGTGRLRLVPAGAGTTAPAGGTDGGTSPVAPAGTTVAPGSRQEAGATRSVPLRRASLAGRVLMSAREHAARTWGEQKRHRSFWHFLWTVLISQPESLAEHRLHIQSRAWLHDYMNGGFRTFCERENVLYHLAVARSVKFACQSADKVFERQYRFWIAVLVTIFGLVIWAVTH